jgi:hypothetical protein
MEAPEMTSPTTLVEPLLQAFCRGDGAALAALADWLGERGQDAPTLVALVSRYGVDALAGHLARAGLLSAADLGAICPWRLFEPTRQIIEQELARRSGKEWTVRQPWEGAMRPRGADAPWLHVVAHESRTAPNWGMTADDRQELFTLLGFKGAYGQAIFGNGLFAPDLPAVRRELIDRARGLPVKDGQLPWPRPRPAPVEGWAPVFNPFGNGANPF